MSPAIAINDRVMPTVGEHSGRMGKVVKLKEQLDGRKFAFVYFYARKDAKAVNAWLPCEQLAVQGRLLPLAEELGLHPQGLAAKLVNDLEQRIQMAPNPHAEAAKMLAEAHRDDHGARVPVDPNEGLRPGTGMYAVEHYGTAVERIAVQMVELIRLVQDTVFELRCEEAISSSTRERINTRLEGVATNVGAIIGHIAHDAPRTQNLAPTSDDNP